MILKTKKRDRTFLGDAKKIYRKIDDKVYGL